MCSLGCIVADAGKGPELGLQAGCQLEVFVECSAAGLGISASHGFVLVTLLHRDTMARND